MAQFGVGRGPAGDYPAGYDDDLPYTPTWQQKYTGIHRDTLVQFAREWGENAEKTRGKNLVIIGAGCNHWYHSNIIYRAAIGALMFTGSVGVSGGGLAHYVGQEKVIPQASWSQIAFAGDWGVPFAQQNAPSYHYVHADQWRYETGFTAYDALPVINGEKMAGHTIDLQVRAVRRGWLPFFPQFNRSALKVAAEALNAQGAASSSIGDPAVDAAVVDRVVSQLKSGELRFAVEDPDAPENWPRVWFIWRGNALGTSAKGEEYFLRHYLGLQGNAIARGTGCGPYQRDHIPP